MGESARIGAGHFAALVGEMGLLACFWVIGLSWGDGRAASFGLALLLVGTAAVVWGVWCAPRAARRLRRTPRWALKIALVSLMVALLVAADAPPTWILVGLGTWALLVGTLPWDTHDPT